MPNSSLYLLLELYTTCAAVGVVYSLAHLTLASAIIYLAIKLKGSIISVPLPS